MTTRTASIRYAGETYHVEYSLEAIQKPEVQAIVGQLKMATGMEGLLLNHRALLLVLVGWDLLDDEGNALPITEEVMTDHLPLLFGVAIVQGIEADVRGMSRIPQHSQGPRFAPSSKAKRKKKGR